MVFLMNGLYCAACGTHAVVGQCECGKAFYCSETCQEDHLENQGHRKICSVLVGRKSIKPNNQMHDDRAQRRAHELRERWREQLRRAEEGGDEAEEGEKQRDDSPPLANYDFFFDSPPPEQSDVEELRHEVIKLRRHVKQLEKQVTQQRNRLLKIMDEQHPGVRRRLVFDEQEND